MFRRKFRCQINSQQKSQAQKFVFNRVLNAIFMIIRDLNYTEKQIIA